MDRKMIKRMADDILAKAGKDKEYPHLMPRDYQKIRKHEIPSGLMMNYDGQVIQGKGKL